MQVQPSLASSHPFNLHSASLAAQVAKSRDSANDSRIPGIGNGGYDAQHYDSTVKVGKDGSLDARSLMTAIATEPLDSLNLDFIGLNVENILVNGKKAAFKREDGELIITPQKGIASGEEFSVDVKYAGKPKPFASKHAPVELGWNQFKGGSFVVSEPDGTRSWLPVNDHPTDKATYSFHVTVPKGQVAAANGVLTSIEEGDDTSTYNFEARDPMASYLATVHTGNYLEEKMVSKGGVPIRNYFPPDIAEKASRDFSEVPDMVDFFSEKFGKYPFEVYGAIVIDANLGGAAALETQTLPLYDRGIVDGRGTNSYVLSHELAHHWFGDSVSPADWKDIWLNEGLASYAEMLWHEHVAGEAALQRDLRIAQSQVQRYGAREPIGEPRADNLFDPKVYKGGALAVHALRRELGDEKFFEALQLYQAQHKNGAASTKDLQAAAEQVSGVDLNDFFQSWIYSEKLPNVPA